MQLNPLTRPSQLELTMTGEHCRLLRQTGRAERAQWWFARMRQIVSLTPPWQPVQKARPWQAPLPIQN